MCTRRPVKYLEAVVQSETAWKETFIYRTSTSNEPIVQKICDQLATLSTGQPMRTDIFVSGIWFKKSGKSS